MQEIKFVKKNQVRVNSPYIVHVTQSLNFWDSKGGAPWFCEVHKALTVHELLEFSTTTQTILNVRPIQTRPFLVSYRYSPNNISFSSYQHLKISKISFPPSATKGCFRYTKWLQKHYTAWSQFCCASVGEKKNMQQKCHFIVYYTMKPYFLYIFFSCSHGTTQWNCNFIVSKKL